MGEIIEIYGEDPECNLDYSKDSQLKSHRANFPSSLFLNIWVADLLYCEEENILIDIKFLHSLSSILNSFVQDFLSYLSKQSNY